MRGRQEALRCRRCAVLPVGSGAREEEVGRTVMSGRGYGVAMGDHPISSVYRTLPGFVCLVCASVLPGCTGSEHSIALLIPCMHPAGSGHSAGSGHRVHWCIPPAPSIPALPGADTPRAFHRLLASLHCPVPDIAEPRCYRSMPQLQASLVSLSAGILRASH